MARSHIKLVAAFVLLTMQITTCAKNNARPVYEIVNEQSRIDEVKVTNTPTLPYGNPLAGNSLQNAKLHASNQQAMFNAEKVRQHRAQLQRLAQAPRLDSYMKAFHETQESHQLALEQQQSTVKESTTPPAKTRRLTIRKRVKQRNQNPYVRNAANSQTLEQRQQQNFRSRDLESLILKSDVREINRNHRSYSPSEFNQFIELNRPNLIIAKPDQRTTIKTNENDVSTKYIPKLLLSSSKTLQEINALETLLTKNPTEQLSEFKTLINSGESLGDKEKSGAPLDLYVYLKNPTAHSLANYYDNLNYAQLPTYPGASSSNDYTASTKQIDDEINPESYKSYVTPNSAEPLTTTSKPGIDFEVLPTRQIEREVSGLSYKALHGDQSTLYVENKDLHENYLSQSPQGVQHLGEDGVGVSAYSDNNLHYASNYEFGYRVRDNASGNYYGHIEAKEGERTNGNYHVLLPDGRIQKVMYQAGPSGYHADISYEN